MPGADFGGVFDRLRAIMAPHTAGMVVVRDLPGDYYVDTGLTRADGYSFAFGAVQVKARYVSYHLTPVYTWPDLLDGRSPALRRRMQGKSCFNFTKVDDEVFAELAVLTGAGAARLRTDSATLTGS